MNDYLGAQRKTSPRLANRSTHQSSRIIIRIATNLFPKPIVVDEPAPCCSTSRHVFRCADPSGSRGAHPESAREFSVLHNCFYDGSRCDSRRQYSSGSAVTDQASRLEKLSRRYRHFLGLSQHLSSPVQSSLIWCPPKISIDSEVSILFRDPYFSFTPHSLLVE